MPDSSDYVRIQYTVYGEVQAVGFRYTASMVARSLGLTGFVRNEYDGSVTLTVQGLESRVAMVIPSIEKSSRWIVIDRVEKKSLPVDVHETTFEVKY